MSDQILQIAEAFAAQLLAELGPDRFAKMKAANQSPKFKGMPFCASHDFCDANMPMLAAFEAVTGKNPVDGTHTEAGQQALFDLWNAAWNHARQTGMI